MTKYLLTLKVPITTAADDKFSRSFRFLNKKGMIFHENRLSADHSVKYALLSSELTADNLCKQFGPSSGPT